MRSVLKKKIGRRWKNGLWCIIERYVESVKGVVSTLLLRKPPIRKRTLETSGRTILSLKSDCGLVQLTINGGGGTRLEGGEVKN